MKLDFWHPRPGYFGLVSYLVVKYKFYVEKEVEWRIT